MRYVQSYAFLFASRNWGMNLLYASLCVLVPIVGPIVLIGYLFEVIDVLLGRRPWPADKKSANRSSEAIREAPVITEAASTPAQADTYPDLTLDRLGDYLTRGIWPFLVQLIVNLPVGIVLVLFWLLGVMGVGIAAANDSGVMAAVVVILLVLLFFLAVLAMGLVTVPLYIRAGLSGDFATAFSMTFLRDFLNRVGKEVLLVQLFLLATGVLLTLVGEMACCIGVYPAMGLYVFAQHHLDLQLYQLYLERGGTPVEAKAADVIRAAPEEDR